MIDLLIELPAQLVFFGGGELLVIGAILGEISYWLWPYRIVSSGPYPGLSLLISPFVNGLLVHALGTWRERHGQSRSYLATFWAARCSRSAWPASASG